MSNISYQSFSLANGLKVVVHEDHSTPKVVVDILYQVGSKDEEPHRTGFAHLFEHLMFEGSKHIAHYDQALQRVGGTNNAFTTSDITNYYLTLPSNQLETAFWLESDRMLELGFSQEKLDIQKSVVIEEYKQRYLNQPYGDAYLRLRELHFQVHPYHWSTIGKEISHIEEATLEEVEDFFYGYYAPNNATLVVAGDVKVDEVKQLAEKWFGEIPNRSLKKHALEAEPPQNEARFQRLYGKVPFPAVYKMYHIPANGKREYFVADILTDILANGKSGWLFQDLVMKKQVASSANAFSWGMHDPGAISIEARVAEGQSVEAVEEAIQACIKRFANLTQEELQRFINKIEATFVFQQTTILSKAMSLAVADSLGDLDLVNKTPEIYQSITLEEIKAAAEKYLRPTNCSTIHYLPKEMEGRDDPANVG